MRTIDATETGIRVHDYVEFLTDALVARGTRGTVIEARPEYDTYLIEITGEEGQLIRLLTAHRAHLALVSR